MPTQVFHAVFFGLFGFQDELQLSKWRTDSVTSPTDTPKHLAAGAWHRVHSITSAGFRHVFLFINIVSLRSIITVAVSAVWDILSAAADSLQPPVVSIVWPGSLV